ncbi:MAG: radical SAM protein [Propionibacteriaceae bacterium]|nr:radical SAM protein [Propionibacteriaceae bacterium]
MQAVIQLTQRCNYHCDFCFANPLPGKQVYASPETYRYLETLSHMGVRRVTFSGGEPTLVRDLTEVVKFAKSFGMTVALATNGSRPHHAALSEVDHIQLSLDGPSTVHNRVRGSRAAYANVVRCIERAQVPVSVQVTVTKETSASLSETLCIIADLPVLFVSIIPVDGARTSASSPWLFEVFRVVRHHFLRKPATQRIFTPLAPRLLARGLAENQLRAGALPWFIYPQAHRISLGSPSTNWRSVFHLDHLESFFAESFNLQRRAVQYLKSCTRFLPYENEVVNVESLVHHAVQNALCHHSLGERR